MRKRTYRQIAESFVQYFETAHEDRLFNGPWTEDSHHKRCALIAMEWLELIDSDPTWPDVHALHSKILAEKSIGGTGWLDLKLNFESWVKSRTFAGTNLLR